MPQVLVRDIDDQTVSRLKTRAIKNGRSLEAELRTILKESAAEFSKEPGTLFKEVQTLFAGRKFEDSTDLIRADRDR